MNRKAATFGFVGVVLFCVLITVFSVLNPEFHPLQDFISLLGSTGQPYALLWNIAGFGVVGFSLAAFGWMYGRVVDDRLIGFLLAFFGVGFAVGGIPFDMDNPTQSASKAHTVAICLAVAAWMFGLARLTSSRSPDRTSKRLANCASVLLILSVAGHVLGLYPMPVLHRLVLATVFTWVMITSIRLLRFPSQLNTT